MFLMKKLTKKKYKRNFHNHDQQRQADDIYIRYVQPYTHGPVENIPEHADNTGKSIHYLTTRLSNLTHSKTVCHSKLKEYIESNSCIDNIII